MQAREIFPLTLILRIFSAGLLLGAALMLTRLAFLPAGADAGLLAFSPNDKFTHFAAFFLVGPLAVMAMPRLPLPLVFGGLALAGAACELVQPFAGRQADLADFLANMAGLAAGLIPVFFLKANTHPSPLRTP